MNDQHTGIAIVMPAIFRNSDALSHCTVAFLGNTDEVDFPKERAQRVLAHLTGTSSWKRHQAIGTAVQRLDLFGVERNVPVGVLYLTEPLQEVREHAERVLEAYDIPYSKAFEYTPHISVNSIDSVPVGLPVQLKAPVLWWGDDRPKPRKPATIDIFGHPVYQGPMFA